MFCTENNSENQFKNAKSTQNLKIHNARFNFSGYIKVKKYSNRTFFIKMNYLNPKSFFFVLTPIKKKLIEI